MESKEPRRRRALPATFQEETVLFVSVLKWVVLATVVGAIVGCSTTVFLRLLDWGVRTAQVWPHYFLVLPVSLFLSAAAVRYLAPQAQGHGTEKVIEAFHKKAGRIPAAVVPVKLAATVVTLATGGSAGKEGPCAQIGAGLASLFADLLRFDNRDRRKLAICGISAGFASVFGTPISGAIFGMEVLFAGSLFYESLLPSFIAGITSFHITQLLGITYFSHRLRFVPVFSEVFFLKVLLAGLFFGLCSILLIKALHYGEKVARRIPVWTPMLGVLGGLVLVGGALLLSPRYLGLGLDTIQSALSGAAVPWYAFLAKIGFTSVTLSFGGSGGIVTPIFFIGATAGSLFGSLLGQDVATFAAIGFVSLLGGAANTPLSASIMAVELFGPAIAPYAAGACVISFLMTGHRSVYPSQILSLRKSESIRVEVGKEMDQLTPAFQPRKGSLITLLTQFRKILPSRRARKRPR